MARGRLLPAPAGWDIEDLDSGTRIRFWSSTMDRSYNAAPTMSFWPKAGYTASYTPLSSR